MARRPASHRAQRGIALLGLLAVAVMVFAYVLASRLNAASQFVGIDRDDNARVLAQAKRALIGWMAINAATDNNPGRLPCPEAVNAIGTNAEGISAPLVTPSTPNCATVGRLPWRTLGLNKLVDAASEPLWYAVSPGWALQNSSTLLSIHADSLGVMVIDGQPTPNEVVALIIAPGPAMNVQAAGGCTARVQARNAPAPAMDPLDYIECLNAATPAFSTTGPATSFNDQVVRVTVGDLMPALEAAIADRAQREIAPAVRSAAFELDSSSPRRWVSTAPLPSGNPLLYPYAVPFTNPTTSVSNYLGVVGTYQGLMPFASAASAVGFLPPNPPPDVIKTTSAGSLNTINCNWESADVYACEGEYQEDGGNPALPITLEMTATFTNVAMGFRARNTAALTAEARNGSSDPWTTSSISTSKQLEMNDGSGGKPRGSVTARLSATLPNIDAMGWATKAQYRLRVSRNVVANHPLLSATGRAVRFSGGSSAINSGNTVTGATSGASGAVQVLINSGDWSTNNAQGMLFFSSVSGSFLSGETLQVSGSSKATAAGTDFDIGWLVRNEWYRNFFYAVAQDNTALVLPSVGGCSSSNCLRFNDPATRNIRALLVLAGRALPTRVARPNNDPLAYVEDQNGDYASLFELRRPKTSNVAITIPPSTLVAPWNDRIVLVDWIAPDPTFPLAYLP